MVINLNALILQPNCRKSFLLNYALPGLMEKLLQNFKALKKKNPYINLKYINLEHVSAKRFQQNSKLARKSEKSY